MLWWDKLRELTRPDLRITWRCPRCAFVILQKLDVREACPNCDECPYWDLERCTPWLVAAPDDTVLIDIDTKAAWLCEEGMNDSWGEDFRQCGVIRLIGTLGDPRHAYQGQAIKANRHHAADWRYFTGLLDEPTRLPRYTRWLDDFGKNETQIWIRWEARPPLPAKQSGLK